MQDQTPTKKEPELRNITCLESRPYLSCYELEYLLSDGRTKKYYTTSSSPDKKELAKITGVAVMALSKDKSRLLLNKEFRMAINGYAYGFPMGMIDGNETPEQAATRELKEETGLDLLEIVGVSPPMYINTGNTANRMRIVTCVADGEIKESENPTEITEPFWTTRNEVLDKWLPEYGHLFSAFAYPWAMFWAVTPEIYS